MHSRRTPVYPVVALCASAACAALLACVLLADAGPAGGKAALGSAPAALMFRDLSGKEWSISGQAGLPAVFVFLSTDCPVANAYTTRLRGLARTAADGGCAFFGVYPNAADSAAAVARHARERGYTFPVVKDDGTLARRLGAAWTAEAVVLDRAGAIAYRGRIDDNADASRVRSHDLADALSSVLAGRRIRRETVAFGCVIQAAPPTPVRQARLTYARDVAPILRRNCVACHRPGEVAPFSMETYHDAAVWAQQIKLVTARHLMPPWKADSHGEFFDERRLTDAEIAMIGRWVDEGAPPGDLRQAPPVPKAAPLWKLGTPDLVAGPKGGYALGADGPDVYRCFVLPTDYPDDRYISAIEVHPGNRAIVHHVIAWLDTSGAARKLDGADGREGYTSTGGFPGFFPAGFLGGWAPGNEPRLLPDGIGMPLPRGSAIVIEVHYHRDGKPEADRTTIGVHFCKGPVDKRLRVLPVMNGGLQLPANDPDCVVRASATLSKAVTVMAVMPHMHLLGRRIAVTAALPGGERKPLVAIRDWDFNWQYTYAFRQPVQLPAGTVIETVAHYDNSTGNPRNPNRPPKPVRWGEQTTDEMNLAFVFYTTDDEHLAGAARRPAP